MAVNPAVMDYDDHAHAFGQAGPDYSDNRFYIVNGHWNDRAITEQSGKRRALRETLDNAASLIAEIEGQTAAADFRESVSDIVEGDLLAAFDSDIEQARGAA